ncbi:MAG: hypothetical protein Q8K86_05730 [Candidatus Nanopelagicaceae bacterium]|nr:hypothetical protein [Candidatus Nanopelagicaceae bacterium]
MSGHEIPFDWNKNPEDQKVFDKYGLDNISMVVDIVNWQIQRNRREQLIRIKYTDDEFGVAAKKLKLPERAYADDAGLDLPTVLDADAQKHDLRVHPDERICLHTGMIAEFPAGHWGLIMHRSSSERRFRLRVVEGVIDEGYRGELLVQVHNMNTWPIDIKHGQKIAQLVLFETKNFKCEVATELLSSERNTNGFGSSSTGCKA